MWVSLIRTLPSTGPELWQAQPLWTQMSGCNGCPIRVDYQLRTVSHQSHQQGSYPCMDQQASVSPQDRSAYPAPQISGPMQEQLTAEELGLSLPQMESFAPDESLGFVSASCREIRPGGICASAIQQRSSQSSVQAARPVQASGTIPFQWFPPTDFMSRPHPA